MITVYQIALVVEDRVVCVGALDLSSLDLGQNSNPNDDDMTYIRR